jgi:RHS repeat-associated protein
VAINDGYDANGNQTVQTFTVNGTAGLPQLHFAFDALNRNTSYTDPLNHTWVVGYNAVGDVTSTIDPLNHASFYQYDARDRVISTTDAMNFTASMGYDLAGNRSSYTDGLNRTSVFAYDPQNRVISRTDAAGGMEHWDYDFAGRQTSFTDADNNVWSWNYDAANRVTAELDPLVHSVVDTYDAANELISKTDRDGRQVAFDHDNAGRLSAERWLDGSGATTRTIAYGYDNANELISANDPDSAYAYTYDTSGLLSSVDNQGTPGIPRMILNFGYEPLGHRTSLTDNLGGTVNYTYDLAARLTNLSMTVNMVQGPNVAVNYDDADRINTITRTMGTGIGFTSIVSTITHDNADRVTGIVHTTPSQTLASFSYTFDAAHELTDYSGPEGALHYSYNATAQLTDVNGAHSEHYAYDPNGNRTLTGYVIGPGNRLLSDGTYNYTYDNEGNELTKVRVSDGQRVEFTWDYRNRMTDVVVKNAAGTVLSSQHNTYDVFDRRIGVSTTVNGQTTQTWTVYDGSNPYADFNSAGALSSRYLNGLGIDQRFARVDATGVTRWYLTDLVGSVRLVVAPTGTVLDHLNYDSFGNILDESSSLNGDRFKFAGRQWDSNLGEYQMRAREYSPGTARFDSEDPSSFGGGDANLYRYVANQPTRFTDPTGLSWNSEINNWIWNNTPGWLQEVSLGFAHGGDNMYNWAINDATRLDWWTDGAQGAVDDLQRGYGIVKDAATGDPSRLSQVGDHLANGFREIGKRPWYYLGHGLFMIFAGQAIAFIFGVIRHAAISVFSRPAPAIQPPGGPGVQVRPPGGTPPAATPPSPAPPEATPPGPPPPEATPPAPAPRPVQPPPTPPSGSWQPPPPTSTVQLPPGAPSFGGYVSPGGIYIPPPDPPPPGPVEGGPIGPVEGPPPSRPWTGPY